MYPIRKKNTTLAELLAWLRVWNNREISLCCHITQLYMTQVDGIASLDSMPLHPQQRETATVPTAPCGQF